MPHLAPQPSAPAQRLASRQEAVPSPMDHAARAGGMGRRQRGGFGLGLIVGLVVGLALALGVALYITKAPAPFVNKVPQRSAEQDAAEAQRNKNWDPNAPLASKVPRPAPPATEEAASGPAAAVAPKGAGSAPVGAAGPGAAGPGAGSARNPASILAGQPPVAVPAAPAPAAAPAQAPAKASKGGEPYTYFVQAGAFQRADDAEAQRARLTMMGLEPRVLEREQGGRTIYRLRLGPYDRQLDAETLRDRLAASGMEAALVRVERAPP